MQESRVVALLPWTGWGKRGPQYTDWERHAEWAILREASRVPSRGWAQE